MQRMHFLSCGVKTMIRTTMPPIPAATTPMIVPMDSSIPNKPGGERKVERVTQDVFQTSACSAASMFSAVSAEEAAYCDYSDVLSDMKSLLECLALQSY